MSKENTRPRRAGTNYGPIPMRDPLLAIQLSYKRKDWIMEFKKANKKGLGTEKWLEKLFQFLSKNDSEILMEDVKRWVENHSWITVAGGHPPEALKVRNQEEPPSASTTTPKKKAAASSSSTHQPTTPTKDKKVTFKTPEVEVHYISPRPLKTPTKKPPVSKVKLPKPPPGYFANNA